MSGELLDWRTKGFWQPDPVPTGDFLAARPGLFDGAFTWPLLVARKSALEHNVRTMADFCAAHGLAFAPHAKTHMAPSLLRAQLAAGAWALTAATAGQVLALRNLGATRVVVAGQLLDRRVLEWLAREREAGFEVIFQVDSAAGVRAAAGLPLPVLVELGHPGGRTGCRTQDELLAVAAAVEADPALRLAGVAGYEGTQPGAEGVSGFLDDLRAAVHALSRVGLLGPEVLVATGGSAWFDLVAARLGAGARWPAGHRVTTVLRSGAYLSHDEGFYRERTPFNRVAGELRPALTLWAQVLSAPEPGLAILGAGKRDVSFDEGLPIPRDGRLTVTKVNDHHLFLADPDGLLRPGDLVELGISHPCTAFDKWRAIPVVDDDGTVTDVLRTHF
ncbi:alanine racemase [Dactylosporangium sp. NPDC049742]|uniref:alanine racemase n=1 Tax=Dactylosporangium sp. NPDC049742 TaxID=3154737 RepID=UPI00343E96B7